MGVVKEVEMWVNVACWEGEMGQGDVHREDQLQVWKERKQTMMRSLFLSTGFFTNRIRLVV